MDDRQKFLLDYNAARWTETTAGPVPTLQLFITNRCNMRCRGCFYQHGLGRDEMTLESYRQVVETHAPQVKKIILLGGEPTLHAELPAMLEINRRLGLGTTIYTNGREINRLVGTDLTNVKLRVGVYGAFNTEKPLMKVADTNLPLTVVYMLRQDNVDELMAAAYLAEHRFDCRGFYLSSIRDIAATGDYWRDNADTVTPLEYAATVQRFVRAYRGGLPRLDIATRGVLKTFAQDFAAQRHCRFGNVFPDGQRILCPLDISLRKTATQLTFNERRCNKHHSCILQKIVLLRRD